MAAIVKKSVMKPGAAPVVKKPAGEKVSVSIGDKTHMPSTTHTGNRVCVSVGKTVNIGNFESLRVDYSESMEVPEGMTFETCRLAAQRSAIKGLHELIEVVETEFKS